jgi:hypothetical protein
MGGKSWSGSVLEQTVVLQCRSHDPAVFENKLLCYSAEVMIRQSFRTNCCATVQKWLQSVHGCTAHTVVTGVTNIWQVTAGTWYSDVLRTTRPSIPAQERDFSLLHNVQTDPWGSPILSLNNFFLITHLFAICNWVTISKCCIVAEGTWRRELSSTVL